MYKGLAFGTGLILAMMLFFNGMMAEAVGVYTSNLIFHGIGFVVILFILLVRRSSCSWIGGISPLYLLPGIFSVISITLNIICIQALGITVTVGTALFGQLLISNLIDHFGWFEMPKVSFDPKKLVGFSFYQLQGSLLLRDSMITLLGTLHRALTLPGPILTPFTITNIT